METRISSLLADRISHWAEEAVPHECCGLLFGSEGQVEQALLAPNVAADPARRFEIDPRVLIDAERAARGEGPPIAGYFHSHPAGSAEPSPADADAAAPDGRLWLIAGEGGLALWKAVPGGALHGRFERVKLQIMG